MNRTSMMMSELIREMALRGVIDPCDAACKRAMDSFVDCLIEQYR